MQDKRKNGREAEDQLLLGQLEEAARALGFTVRVERGNFRSGRCRRREEELIILNRRLGTFERAQTLARILAAGDLERAFLKPALRARIASLAVTRAAAPVPSLPAAETGGAP
jgi:hypothetical protein